MVWFIVPTFNEKKNIRELLERVFGISAEICVLVVDDASPDGTADEVEVLSRTQPKLHLLRRAGKLGLGSAYREGFRYALDHGAAAVGEMDADLSHAPEDLPRLMNELVKGADVVIGSRRVSGGKIMGWSWWRLFTSWGATALSRFVLGMKTKDITAGFRLYSPRFLSVVPWETITSNGYAWQEETLYLAEAAGLSVKELPVVFHDRQKGNSKLSFRDVVEFFLTLMRLWLNKQQTRG